MIIKKRIMVIYCPDDNQLYLDYAFKGIYDHLRKEFIFIGWL